MEQGLEETESSYAAEGTLAHAYVAFELGRIGKDPSAVDFDGGPVSPEMVEALDPYYRSVKAESVGNVLLVEQPLPLEQVTLEKDAEGTGDATILYSDGVTLSINDLKYGMGVKVYAKRNRQLMLYALGALHKFVALGDWQRFVLRIHQVRLNHLDEWECSYEELEEFAEEVRFRAQFIWRLLRGEVEFNPREDLVPDAKACLWCRAKATCPAAINYALTVAASDFTVITADPTKKLEAALAKVDRLDSTQLSWVMQNVGFLEGIVKAVRARVESELLAGRDIPNFRLVYGKKGNRKWTDETEVTKLLKKSKLKSEDIYKKKLISPADVEKLLKKTNPKIWEALTPFYHQADGGPSVALFTDPRPALLAGARSDDFEAIGD